MPHAMKKALDQFRASTAHLAQRLLAKKSDVSPKIGELYLYDVIGQDWFGGVTAKDVADALAKVKDASVLNVYLNSPGGDVFDGVAIYNQIRRFDGEKNVYVDGLAASIASVIALAGDKVYTAPNAMWMVHNPWTYAVGNANDLRKVAEDMDKTCKAMVDTYVRKTGNTEAAIRELMDAETWMDAETALEHGFTDEVLADDDAEDCVCGAATCGKDCPCNGECSAKGGCCDCKDDEDGADASAQSSHPVLARYKNTPETIRARVTTRAKIADVTKRLTLRRAGLPK